MLSADFDCERANCDDFIGIRDKAFAIPTRYVPVDCEWAGLEKVAHFTGCDYDLQVFKGPWSISYLELLGARIEDGGYHTGSTLFKIQRDGLTAYVPLIPAFSNLVPTVYKNCTLSRLERSATPIAFANIISKLGLAAAANDAHEKLGLLVDAYNMAGLQHEPVLTVGRGAYLGERLAKSAAVFDRIYRRPWIGTHILEALFGDVPANAHYGVAGVLLLAKFCTYHPYHLTSAMGWVGANMVNDSCSIILGSHTERLAWIWVKGGVPHVSSVIPSDDPGMAEEISIVESQALAAYSENAGLSLVDEIERQSDMYGVRGQEVVDSMLASFYTRVMRNRHFERNAISAEIDVTNSRIKALSDQLDKLRRESVLLEERKNATYVSQFKTKLKKAFGEVIKNKKRLKILSVTPAGSRYSSTQSFVFILAPVYIEYNNEYWMSPAIKFTLSPTRGWSPISASNPSFIGTDIAPYEAFSNTSVSRSMSVLDFASWFRTIRQNVAKECESRMRDGDNGLMAIMSATDKDTYLKNM